MEPQDAASLVERREANIIDNKAVLKKLMHDLHAVMPSGSPVTPPPRKYKKRERKDEVEVVRRKSARLSSKYLSSPIKTESRRGSVSPPLSSSASSSPNRLVVRFGFSRRADFAESDEDASSNGDVDELPIRRAVPVRDNRSAEDITEDDLKLVAEFVSEKKYDSIYGSSCHQCRQKTNDMKTICRSGRCFGVRGQFCGPCLRNRYGEDSKTALKDPNWECPPCRQICNCSFCRKKQGKGCTGILIHQARERGFSDVNRYLESLR